VLVAEAVLEVLALAVVTALVEGLAVVLLVAVVAGLLTVVLAGRALEEADELAGFTVVVVRLLEEVLG
jgi:hypothetical protein